LLVAALADYKIIRFESSMIEQVSDLGVGTR
jgi:hypothetical protein